MIKLKRIYDTPAAEDGARFLVDGLWPRGLKREHLCLDAWLKEVAPSGELRRWFAHDPVRWVEFRRRYFAELNGKSGHGSPFWRPAAGVMSPYSIAPETRSITMP